MRLSRRDLLRSSAVAAAAGILRGSAVAAVESVMPTAETLAGRLHASLSETQRRQVCFGWDHVHPKFGLLRTRVGNNWNVTDPEVAGDFFTKVIHVNLIGTFLCDKAAASLMQHNAPNEDGERGLLIHTSSVAAFEGQIGQAAYSATKAALAGMTLPLAREFAAFGIRVMSIAPGIFHTPMVGGMTPEVQASLASQIPFPARLGRPDEYARLVESIYEIAMLNGETIRLDGAIRMQPK